MIVVICGPTASGKSKLAIRLAQDFNGEIINGDAFQVYKELEIGTAKPTKEELMMATHHLFDYVEPTKNHSVMDYQVEARKTINEILSRKKLVVIVGGTGLYQKASLYDYTFTEEKENVDLSDLASLSNEELYNYSTKGKNYCCDCGCEILNTSERCVACKNKMQRVVKRPTREELKTLIRTLPFTQIGKRFGVSDNAIRKWCYAEKLPVKKGEINKYSEEEWSKL